MSEHVIRATDAYPCAHVGCDKPGVGVEHVRFQVLGRTSVAFYGFCVNHDPRLSS